MGRKLTERQKEFLQALAKAGGRAKVWKLELGNLPRYARRSLRWEGIYKLKIASQLQKKGLVKLYQPSKGGWEVELVK